MTKARSVNRPSHTRRTNPKGKFTRIFNENLWGQAKAPVERKHSGKRPGQHGAARKKLTDFAVQLREKQKIKAYYGSITERQFRNTFTEAARRKGDTGENLVGLLESRLDSIVYRLNIAPTIFAAKQMVSHKHITVNGKPVNIASYRCSPGDVIEVREQAKTMTSIIGTVQKMDRQVPEYLSFDPNAFKGTYVRMPTLDEVPYPVQMNPALVVEFYNR